MPSGKALPFADQLKTILELDQQLADLMDLLDQTPEIALRLSLWEKIGQRRYELEELCGSVDTAGIRFKFAAPRHSHGIGQAGD